MPVVHCPNCDRSYQVPDNKIGTKATCPKCKCSFLATPRDDTTSLGRNQGATPSETPDGSDDRDTAPRSSRKRLGRFEIIERLGVGGYGTVYRARDTKLDREVALKIPELGSLGSKKAAQRFLREARAAGNLRHPNIVPIYDAGQTGGSYFIASGYIEGQTLEARLHEEQRLSCQETVALIKKLAGALHYAHCKGIVHRDVKPANVMIDTDGEPLLLDFGTARREEGDVLLTQEGARIGTPAYMSPEQHAGQSHQADARSDQMGARRDAVRDAHRPAAVSSRHRHPNRLPGPRDGTGPPPKD